MTKHIENLAWDTEFFSVSIGRIKNSFLDDETVAAVLDEARRDGLRCLYFEAEPNDLTTVLTVEKNGFHLVDVRVVLQYSFDNLPAPSLKYPIPSELVITEAVESDLPRLEEIAVGVGEFSRYTFDSNFGLEDNERLYRMWIRNSFHGLADIVFVARWGGEGGDVVGLITCLAREGIGYIDLAGVHHEYRRKRIGTCLVQSALDWGGNQDIGEMQVLTQARNVPAQRLYQRMGFLTKSMTLFFHKWL
jgi:GNAT superfamily N-acetyltransferase